MPGRYTPNKLWLAINIAIAIIFISTSVLIFLKLISWAITFLTFALIVYIINYIQLHFYRRYYSKDILQQREIEFKHALREYRDE